MTAIDPKLAKIVRLWRSATIPGEKAAARARAEEMASAIGLTLDEVVAAVDAPKPSASNIFDGFDDFMEREEPGWKARRAAEKAARRRENAKKRAAVIAKYGSEELALEPCERERLILVAVAPWRQAREAPHQRWTDRLDGWHGIGFERDKMPPHVLAAIEAAYPLPVTFAQAKAEHEYWTERDDEIGLILDTSGDGYGDIALDMAAGVRAEIVRDQTEHLLPTLTLQEVYERFVIYRALENMNDTIEAALFRDIERLALTKHLFKPSIALHAEGELRSSPLHPSTTSNRGGRIHAALDADPSRPDRDIARACGCSPSTVGKVRRTMGLAQMPRSVQRGGQMYQASFAFEGRTP